MSKQLTLNMLTGGLFMAFGVSVATADHPIGRSSPYSLTISAATLQDERQHDEQDEHDSHDDGDEHAQEESIGDSESMAFDSEYKEISSFFNVREANANVTQGVWEYEIELGWSTGGGGDDDLLMTHSIKYGITDQLFAELELLPLNLGDGGEQGNGELAFILFNQFAAESDAMPAIAGWAELRIPSAHESSGVDAEFHMTMTKTLLPKLRGHVDGFVMTANGQRGPEEDDSDELYLFGGDDHDSRRHFQWGVGVGLDYQCTDNMITTVNYLHRSSEDYGHANSHVLELGAAYELTERQHLKWAFDIGLDGRDENPNFGAKLQWSIEF